MERQDVVNFIVNEAKRLEEEEHVMDLAKAGRYEELKGIEIHITRELYEYSIFNDDNIELELSEIPEGLCLHVAMLENATNIVGYDTDLVADVSDFADRLAKEAGDIGKNIAFRMIERNEYIADMNSDEFFSDYYASDWDVQ